MFVDSPVIKQQFYCSYLWIGGGGCKNGHFFWICDPRRCLKGHLYTRFICSSYRPFVNSLLHLVRSYVVMVFAHPKVATIKLRKTKCLAVQFCKSHQMNYPQKNYCHHRQELRQLARNISCSQKDSVQESVTRPTVVFSKI